MRHWVNNFRQDIISCVSTLLCHSTSIIAACDVIITTTFHELLGANFCSFGVKVLHTYIKVDVFVQFDEWNCFELIRLM